MQIFDRYNIVGTSGSGKTTFARKLSRLLGRRCVELDQLYWGKDWAKTDDVTLAARLSEAIEQDCWVLDGNYKSLTPLKWRRELCVVWLDYSFARVFLRALRRALRRAWTKEELWPNTGCKESFRKLFFSKDSILLWTLQTFRSSRKRYTALSADPRYSHVHFLRFTSPKQAHSFLLQIAGEVDES